MYDYAYDILGSFIRMVLRHNSFYLVIANMILVLNKFDFL